MSDEDWTRCIKVCRESDVPLVHYKHHHSGLAMMTPAAVHYGRVNEVLVVRDVALAEAYARDPERFVRRSPVAARPQVEAWSNPPAVRASSFPYSTSTHLGGCRLISYSKCLILVDTYRLGSVKAMCAI